METKRIWRPVEFNTAWNTVSTEKFDSLYPSWKRRRVELLKNPEQYDRFIDQLKRRQAIDTGIIERMYNLKSGITETFIREGFVDSYLQHGDTDISPTQLMNFLRDNFEAIDFIFDFVKSERALSVSFIRELHSLITQHQMSTEAVDSLGRHVSIPMLRGEYKKHPNNPSRDGVVYEYCPPEQVASEMERLIDLYSTDLHASHVLVRAAFLHHAFVQIHPFQDGNGRIARLLASLVLIKEGLFPLSIDRGQRSSYIDALESADGGQYQPLIDIIARDQLASIEKALNLGAVETGGYEGVLDLLSQRLLDYRAAQNVRRKRRIEQNMSAISEKIGTRMSELSNEIRSKLGSGAKVVVRMSDPSGGERHFYAGQIIAYAKQHDYYVNLSLDRYWCRVFVEIDESRKYRLVVSLHHYGYDDSTFAIGAFLSKVVPVQAAGEESENEYVDIPLAIPPLVFSSDRNVDGMTSSIGQQVETSVMVMLACIANELV